MKSKSERLIALFGALEQTLAQLGLWEDMPPSEQALASSQPFAIDTLEPQQWLQWVFIPKMRAMITAQQPLPSGFEISPYFEQVWQDKADHCELIALLKTIDSECA